MSRQRTLPRWAFLAASVAIMLVNPRSVAADLRATSGDTLHSLEALAIRQEDLLRLRTSLSRIREELGVVIDVIDATVPVPKDMPVEVKPAARHQGAPVNNPVVEAARAAVAAAEAAQAASEFTSAAPAILQHDEVAAVMPHTDDDKPSRSLGSEGKELNGGNVKEELPAQRPTPASSPAREAPSTVSTSVARSSMDGEPNTAHIAPSLAMPAMPPFMRTILSWAWNIIVRIFWSSVFCMDIGIVTCMQMLGRNRRGSGGKKSTRLDDRVAEMGWRAFLNDEAVMAAWLSEHGRKLAIGLCFSIMSRLPQHLLGDDSLMSNVLLNFTIMMRVTSFVMLLIQNYMTSVAVAEISKASAGAGVVPPSPRLRYSQSLSVGGAHEE